ncbi:ABC transporter substrate-binding protein [Frankia sp. CNm7]|uniref:ABC transporter substrate-binding protein n=1 Tax=Frankia nepalensis TaxID=1836974 RepID=A0A937RHV0_9ACTN|nr:ABC transporter substrate-binding protein [Frankia nepalensis]MBL7499920.1 ABC transporter substrate-binding protein [Frankia nepalensis]MBL7511717.1 ABC transporter substrate-binding protein [Frankia nepalensis]MBL7523173.1 ABC transporter substrate-binding protein [Frankia nepalensis]MBL7632523.1 ABC transporter substrate-binding protein [Frankia nepalensis]
MRRRHTLRLAAAALGSAVALAACSESGSGGGDTGGTPVASGAPVKLMVISAIGTAGSNYPDMLAATKAAVRGLNERGGIKGHQVELVHCDEKNDPEAAKACAQRAVDENVLAVVNEVSASGGIMPILEAASIPSIGSSGISADLSELSSPVSFVLSPLTYYPAVCPALLKKAGATKLGLVGYNLSLSDRLVKMAEIGATNAGSPLALEPRVPIDTSDFTPTATQLTRGGVDGTVLVVVDQAAYAVIQAGGTDQKYCHSLGVLSRDWLIEQGAQADSVVLASAFPELSQADAFPEVARAVKELEAEAAAADGDPAADPAKSITSTNTLGAWLSVQIVEQVANAIPGDELTSAALLAQLNKTSNLDLGVLPPLDFTKPSPIPGAERLFNTTMRGVRWDSATKSYLPLGTETYDALQILTQAGS